MTFNDTLLEKSIFFNCSQFLDNFGKQFADVVMLQSKICVNRAAMTGRIRKN